MSFAKCDTLTRASPPKTFEPSGPRPIPFCRIHTYAAKLVSVSSHAHRLVNAVLYWCPHLLVELPQRVLLVLLARSGVERARRLSVYIQRYMAPINQIFFCLQYDQWELPRVIDKERLGTNRARLIGHFACALAGSAKCSPVAPRWNTKLETFWNDAIEASEANQRPVRR